MKITFELTEDEKKVLSILKKEAASFRGVLETSFPGLEDSLKKFEKAGLVKKHDEPIMGFGHSYTLTSFGCDLVISPVIEI